MRKRKNTLRLVDFDYRRAGAYFVTCVAAGRCSRFGIVDDDCVLLSADGLIVQQKWLDLPGLYRDVALDAHVIMPNHLHGIIVLQPDETLERDPQMNDTSLSQVMRAFKSMSARAINRRCNSPGAPVWQRGYMDRIIRNRREHEAFLRYIDGNPASWHADRFHP